MASLVQFGRRVRRVRTAAGVTRELAAERAGITPNYLGQIERGEKWPTFEVIEGLARAVQVTPNAFFDYQADENSPESIRKQISQLLSDKDVRQLQRALRILQALLIG